MTDYNISLGCFEYTGCTKKVAPWRILLICQEL